MEAAERLIAGEERVAPEDIRFSYSRPEQRWYNRGIIRLIERLSGQPRLERLYRHWSRNPPAGENIFSAGLRLMRIGIATNDAMWDKVPREGPVLFIANHPFGVIDGLAMGHLATRVRPDTRIMTHSLLCQPPEARDYLLPASNCPPPARPNGRDREDEAVAGIDDTQTRPGDRHGDDDQSIDAGRHDCVPREKDGVSSPARRCAVATRRSHPIGLDLGP